MSGKEDPPAVFAPWTDAQVDQLNRWQAGTLVHPFTCGHDSGHRVLRATTAGWVCEDCTYTQNWAHAFFLLVDPATVQKFVRPPKTRE